MKTRLLPLLMCCGALAIAATAEGQGNSQTEYLEAQKAPPMLGIHWARDFQPNARAIEEAQKDARAARPRGSANKTYHGGVIMPASVTKAIFWGTSWGTYTGDKISGMDTWYSGVSNSNYAKTSDEYSGSNGQVGP